MQYESTTSLPQPDAASAAHSARVATYLRERIGDGMIGFGEFVHEALYSPGLGYYAAGTQKFGAAGDFVTAPEVSNVFGAVLARQCAEVLADIDDAAILEFGAGSGKLAVDLLHALEKLDALPERYLVLEVSPELQARQQATIREAIPSMADRIEWLAGLPQHFNGVMLANEVLDALPFERFTIENGDVLQQCVTVRDDRFAWTTRPAPDLLLNAVRGIERDIGEALPDGYTSEVSMAAAAWITDLAAALETGAAFLFDYGLPRRELYAAERGEGWLRCHFRHHAHNDPLILPGIQDITTWVDFTALAEAADGAGMNILGFTTQAQFLLGGGLQAELAALAELPLERQLELSGQVKTLTLPGEMGESFKCIALGRGAISVPTAFHFADRTQTL